MPYFPLFQAFLRAFNLFADIYSPILVLILRSIHSSVLISFLHFLPQIPLYILFSPIFFFHTSPTEREREREFLIGEPVAWQIGEGGKRGKRGKVRGVGHLPLFSFVFIFLIIFRKYSFPLRRLNCQVNGVIIMDVEGERNEGKKKKGRTDWPAYLFEFSAWEHSFICPIKFKNLCFLYDSRWNVLSHFICPIIIFFIF